MLRASILLTFGIAALGVAAAESPDAVLRLHGSNTIGARLAPALVRAYAETHGYVASGGESQGQESWLRLEHEQAILRVEIHAHGTGTGFAALRDGTADIWMASRPVTASEIAQGAPLGPLDAPAQEHIVALDGLAILVHPSNPVATLGITQLADVFTGRTKDWAEVGGAPGPIVVHARDDRSGTYDTFQSLVLRDGRLSPRAIRYESSDQLAAAVAADPAAIGFAGLAAIGASKVLAISEPGTRALRPDTLAVATEDYALARRLFLYHRADPTPQVASFVEFALGPRGQAIAERVGFVAQEIRALRIAARDDIGGEYAGLTKDARRLTVNFRFSAGRSYLDGKSLRDLDRLVDWLRRNPSPGAELMLFGFADRNETNPVQALALSADRADFVAALLAARGAPPRRVRGVGDSAPVAADDTPAGRARNRRVEVWLKPGTQDAAATVRSASVDAGARNATWP